MSSSDSLTQCPACSYANPLDSKFCQKCGKKLVHSCRRCGAENLLDAEFCKSCGVKLSEAKFGITKQHADKWRSHFSSFPGAASIWASKGYGTTKVVPLANQIMEASDPRPLPKSERTAFLLPIADRDWCIRTAQFNATTITYGAVWVCTTRFALFDFMQRRAYSVPYELLTTVNRQGDSISLNTSDGSTIHFVIRVPRPSKGSNVARFLLDVVRILGSQTAADRELISQGSKHEASEYRQRVQTADSFIASIFNFFSEIVNRKRELDQS